MLYHKNNKEYYRYIDSTYIFGINIQIVYINFIKYFIVSKYKIDIIKIELQI